MCLSTDYSKFQDCRKLFTDKNPNTIPYRSRDVTVILGVTLRERQITKINSDVSHLRYFLYVNLVQLLETYSRRLVQFLPFS